MRTLLAALTALMLFATPVVAASDPPVQSAEVVFWQSISSSTDAVDFVAYLERYPHGVFAPLARNKLKLDEGQKIRNYIRKLVDDNRIFLGCEGDEYMLPTAIDRLGNRRSCL